MSHRAEESDHTATTVRTEFKRRWHRIEAHYRHTEPGETDAVRERSGIRLKKTYPALASDGRYSFLGSSAGSAFVDSYGGGTNAVK